MLRPRLAGFALVVFALAPRVAGAQSRAGYFDTPASVRLVGTPQPGRSVPLLIVLPPTGASADEVYRTALAAAVGLDAYVLLTPAGTPERRDYLPDFGRYVDWFDTRLAADVPRALAQYPVDRTRIYLAGFSLGGDLAWALLARHPDAYRGAVVLGSRCSAAVDGADLAALRAHDARLSFAIGDGDDAGRRRGLQAAYRRVNAAHVAATLRTYAGGHELPRDASVLAALFRALFAGDSRAAQNTTP